MLPPTARSHPGYMIFRDDNLKPAFDARPRSWRWMSFYVRQRMKTITNGTQAVASPVREGLFGLVVSGISAAVSITAIMAWIYMAGSTATIESGGPAFAANIEPMANSFLGIASGGVGLLITACSIWFSDKRFPKSFTFYHFCSFTFLIPSAFLLVTMFTR